MERVSKSVSGASAVTYAVTSQGLCAVTPTDRKVNVVSGAAQPSCFLAAREAIPVASKPSSRSAGLSRSTAAGCQSGFASDAVERLVRTHPCLQRTASETSTVPDSIHRGNRLPCKVQRWRAAASSLPEPSNQSMCTDVKFLVMDTTLATFSVSADAVAVESACPQTVRSSSGTDGRSRRVVVTVLTFGSMGLIVRQTKRSAGVACFAASLLPLPWRKAISLSRRAAG